jgi:hypothetical protein
VRSIDLAWRIRVRPRDEIGDLLAWLNTFLDNLVTRQETERELVRAKEADEAASRAKSMRSVHGEFLRSPSRELVE